MGNMRTRNVEVIKHANSRNNYIWIKIKKSKLADFQSFFFADFLRIKHHILSLLHDPPQMVQKCTTK